MKRADNRVATSDSRYQLFLLASLGFALILGFVLPVLLASATALGIPRGVRWEALVQVHGQVQLLGFGGCFVLGMAYRLMPRFSGTPLRHGWTVLPVLLLTVIAILLRTLAQPLPALPARGALLTLAGICLAAAGLLFYTAISHVLLRPLRQGRIWAAFAASGAFWFAVQAFLTGWLLLDLVLGRASGASLGEGKILAAPGDELLVLLQFYGFVLSFIIGVTGRTVPVFFAFKPARVLPALTWALLQFGILLSAAGLLVGDASVHWALIARAAGFSCLGLALIGGALWTGCWRPASRLRPSSRPAVFLLRAAYCCCALAGLLNLVLGLQIAFGVVFLPGNAVDAIRHLIALGVLTMLIVAMAHLVEPALASERFAGVDASRRLRTLALLLILSVVFRALPPLIPALGARLSFGLIGGAGVLAWIAVAIFARSLWRAHNAASPGA